MHKVSLYILILSVITFILAMLSVFRRYLYVKDSFFTQGKVVKIVSKKNRGKRGRSSTSYIPEVRYKREGEEPRKFKSHMGSSLMNYRVGDIVPVVYNNKKNNELIGTYGHLYGASTFFGLISLSIIIGFTLLNYSDNVMNFLHKNYANKSLETNTD